MLLKTLAVAALAATTVAAPAHGEAPTVTGTYSAGTARWQALSPARLDGSAKPAAATVVIDPSRTEQHYAGIGFSIDETSVANLWKLTPAERERAVKLLVDPESGAGLDRFRLTIGSPDLIEHLPFWSYDELPAGETSDRGLRHFSIQRDVDLHIVDTVKLIQKHNPRATFFASAWSAPAWMKTNNRFLGEVALKPGSTTDYYQAGKLRDDCVDVFARYYVKYLQAYARHGIRIDAITLLNEPGMDVVYPAMDISVEQQQRLAVAIKREFRRAGLRTDLYVHDFNFWDWRDPNSTATKNYHRILDDRKAAAAADAIAFHPYWGDPTVMRDAYRQTGKPVHMTETSDLSPATVLSYFRLDASSYVLWAQTTDQDGGTLHWTGARDNDVDWDEVARTSKWPDRLVKVDTNTGTFSVRDELYQLGQFAKYLTPRHVRVESSAADHGVSSAVFRDGDDYVAVLGNANATATSVRVIIGDRSFVGTVPAGAYASYRWTSRHPDSRHHRAPRLAGVPDVVAEQYATVRIPLHATGSGHGRLAFYATDLPAGASVDADTGVVTLSPAVAGEQEFTVAVTDGRAHAETTVHVSTRPHGAPVGAIVEAEAYTAQHGWTEGGANFVESNGAASGGKNVGWTAPGNWLSYRFDVPGGSHRLQLRVANGSGAAATGAISIRDAAGTVLSLVSVPDTGGWGSYQTVEVPVSLADGDQALTVYCETGGFNLDYLRLTE